MNLNAKFLSDTASTMDVAPKSEMQSSIDSLFYELDSLNQYVTNLENKLIPVLIPVGEGKQGSSPAPATPIAAEAPMLAQLRHARSAAMALQERLGKLRDNLVV